MARFLIILFILTSFSCKEKDEPFKEPEKPGDTIRHTVCLYQSADTLICNNAICDTGMCPFYQDIWKETLIMLNDLDSEYFYNHITVSSTQIYEWQEGYAFEVDFWLTHGWARTHLLHSFIVKINPGNTLYPDVYLRRGVYLNKQEVIRAVYFDAFNSKMEKISNLEGLKYSSMQSALDQLIDSSNADTLCYYGICIDRFTGNLNLEARGQYADEYNSCIFGFIDLFTGETKFENGPCWYDDP